MIEVRNASKRFGSVMAVSGLSFTAPDGAITGLLGSNGAGKTTTLRMIAGVLHPDTGWAGVDEVSGAAAQLRLGALLDHAGLYPRLTARENVTYFARLRGLTGHELGTRVAETTHLLGLTQIADRRVRTLSQGEQMRVALARALIHSPKNVVLDEPTNGLDVPAVRSLRELLRRLRADGCCVVFSSHVLPEVNDLCDGIVVMRRGTLAAEGSPEKLLSMTASSTLEDAFVKITQDQGAIVCS